MKKYYPILLILVGMFLVFFPFNLVESNENSVFFNILFAVPAIGFLIYYKRRKEYSPVIKKIVIVCALILPLMLVGAAIVGVIMGINIALFPPDYDNTKDIDTEILEREVLDWVNISRYKSNAGGLNLDESLNNLAEIRKMELIEASPNEMEELANIDASTIAKREGIQCTINEKAAFIDDYILTIPHSEYPDVKRLTEHLMNHLISNEDAKEIVFASNVTKTGISSFVTKDFLIVIQNFC